MIIYKCFNIVLADKINTSKSKINKHAKANVDDVSKRFSDCQISTGTLAFLMYFKGMQRT